MQAQGVSIKQEIEACLNDCEDVFVKLRESTEQVQGEAKQHLQRAVDGMQECIAECRQAEESL